MPFNTTILNTALEAMADRIVSVSLHTGNPGTTGANELTGGGYTRQTPTWGTAAAGVIETTASMVFPIAAGNSISYVGLWDTGPVFVGSAQISPAEIFNNDGQLTVQELTITATST